MTRRGVAAGPVALPCGSPVIHRLRPADSDDFASLWSLYQVTHRARRGSSDGANESELRARFTQRFAREPIEVVEVDGALAGMLAVRWDEDPVVVSLLQLWPRMQGRGLGTRLLHDVLVQAQQEERAVELSVGAEDPARGLLDRLGIKPVAPVTDPVRYRWEASIRTDVTLRAAMSPWADPGRRHAWARRLFGDEPDEAVELVRFVIGRYGLPAAASVLELDAGVGSRVRALVDAGFSVTACAVDPAGREAVAKQVARAGCAATERVGIEGIDGEATHDLVLAVDGAWWRLLEHTTRVDVARRLRAVLRPGGVVIIEGPNFPWILKAYREPPPKTVVYHRATVSRIRSHTLDFHAGQLRQSDTFVAEVDGEEPVDWVEEQTMALMGLPMLRLALEEAGLSQIETFGSMTASGPGRIMGPRMVVVARAE